MMLVSDAARGPLLAIVPVLYWAGQLSFGALLAVTFAVGCFTAPYYSSSRLIIPDVAGEDERASPSSTAFSAASPCSRRFSARLQRA